MPPNSPRRTVLLCAALAVVIAALYWPVLRAEFINFDDPDYVTENSIVQRGITAEGVKWAFGRFHGEKTYYHPLTWLSHMLDCQLFGLNPAGHHGINILFHIANSILLLLFLHNLTGSFWRSAGVAAIFAVHPLQIESVAWVTERKNLLSTLFWLLTSGAYVKFVRTKKTGAYVLSLALFACALLSKPAVVTLPFVFLLLDAWPLKRFSPATPRFERFRVARTLVFEKVPFLILSAASAAITILGHERIGIKAAADELPLIYRVQNALVSYALYLKKIFFPFDLGIFYPHPRLWPSETVIIASLVLVAVTVIVLLQMKRRPYVAVGWFWFLGVLVPAIGIVQVGYQAMADRFAYVPIIGILIMVIWAAAEFLSSRGTKHVAIGALALVAIIYFGSGTAAQLRHWKDSETVFRRALAVTQRNYIAHINLAAALLGKGKLDEAESQARLAVQVHDKDQLPFTLLGSIEVQRNNLPAAVSNYTLALALNPDAASTRFLLASALLNSGQHLKAKEHFIAITAVQQYKPEAHASLGLVFTAEKSFSAAVEQYREALKLRADWPVVLNNLAWLLATGPDAQLRDGPEAVRLAQRACELSRNEEPMFIGTLAAAYAQAGRFPDAIATCKRAQALAVQRGITDLAQRNAELLKLYESGKPYHEPP